MKRHYGTILTALIAIIAFSVQWGMVSARLTGVEKRLDQFLAEATAARETYVDLERRVAFLEGKDAAKKEHKQ